MKKLTTSLIIAAVLFVTPNALAGKKKWTGHVLTTGYHHHISIEKNGKVIRVGKLKNDGTGKSQKEAEEVSEENADAENKKDKIKKNKVQEGENCDDPNIIC